MILTDDTSCLTECVNLRDHIFPFRRASQLATVTLIGMTSCFVWVAMKGKGRLDDLVFYWLLIVPFASITIFALSWASSHGIAKQRITISVKDDQLCIDNHPVYGCLRIALNICRWNWGFSFNDPALLNCRVARNIVIAWPPFERGSQIAVGHGRDASALWLILLRDKGVPEGLERGRFERVKWQASVVVAAAMGCAVLWSFGWLARRLGVMIEIPIASLISTALLCGYATYIYARQRCGDVALCKEWRRVVATCGAVIVFGIFGRRVGAAQAWRNGMPVDAIVIAAVQIGVAIAFMGTLYRREKRGLT